MSVPGVSIGRQLSLDQPAPRRKSHLRRQRSAEDDRTFPIYTNSIARGKSSANKSRRFFEKPKVRVAWTENRCRNERSLDRVEVVARHMPGRSRPSTGRSNRSTEKPSILYSREELAERLRLAWRHREENRANIDIYLGHRLPEERSESERSELTVTVPSTPERSVSGRPEDRKSTGYAMEKQGLKGDRSEPMEERTDLQDITSSLVPEVENNRDVADRTEVEYSEASSRKRIEREQELKIPMDDFSLARKKRASFQSGSNKAFLRHIKMDDPGFGSSGDVKVAGQKTLANLRQREKERQNKDKENTKEVSRENSKEVSKENTKEVSKENSKEVSKENAKEVSKENTKGHESFTMERKPSGKNTISGNDGNEAMQIDKQRSPEAKGNEKICTGSRRDCSRIEQRTRRTNSAPPHRFPTSNPGNRVQVNIVIDTPNFGPVEKEETAVDKECKGNTEKMVDEPSKLFNRPIRSAPLKRRARSAKKRSLAGSSSVRGENLEKSRVKNCLDPRGMDVVTMVSLVSSADSDTEPENSPMDDKLIDQLRSKLPTTSIIKPSIGTGNRKPIKSVSFQQDSLDDEQPANKSQQQPQAQQQRQQQQQTPQLPSSTRDERKFNPRYTTVCTRVVSFSNEEQIVWRTDIPGLALPVLHASLHEVEEQVELPLTDREKRCLAVPIGDLTGDNRKLVRARSTPCRGEIEKRSVTDTKEQTSTIVCLANESATLQNRSVQETVKRKVELTPRKDPGEQVAKVVVAEPRFQTSKEKECWHLYKKMCDKGVYVSFDTVLRGMLTPTEYRLRQKELLQDF